MSRTGTCNLCGRADVRIRRGGLYADHTKAPPGDTAELCEASGEPSGIAPRGLTRTAAERHAAAVAQRRTEDDRDVRFCIAYLEAEQQVHPHMARPVREQLRRGAAVIARLLRGDKL